jgi:hypothetical protein
MISETIRELFGNFKLVCYELDYGATRNTDDPCIMKYFSAFKV